VTVAGTLTVANGGTGATTFTSNALLKGAGASAITTASAADIVTAIGSTAVTNATNATRITNSGGWNVTPTGTKLVFSYNGVDVASLDSTGNFIAKANVTAFGTP
jgi:stage V sporulation protein SpoVS